MVVHIVFERRCLKSSCSVARACIIHLHGYSQALGATIENGCRVPHGMPHVRKTLRDLRSPVDGNDSEAENSRAALRDIGAQSFSALFGCDFTENGRTLSSLATPHKMCPILHERLSP